jgi:hypothetical protein
MVTRKKTDPVDAVGRMSALLDDSRRARDLAMAQALIIREAAIEASQTFRHYAETHRGKGDEEKARRNENEAYKLTAAIMATANLPDFRAEADRVSADLARVTAERDAALAILDLFAEVEDVAAKDAGRSFGLYVDAMEKARALRARKVGG